jgi:uncharacterized protein YkwD
MQSIILFLLVFFTGMNTERNDQLLVPTDQICINHEESELYRMINLYRKQKNLDPIPISSALTQVAQSHVKDLNQNYKQSEKCNPHSWSRNGKWTACCYTSDHKKASCMWDKPREIAGYESEGFEIAYWHSARATASDALAGWKKSSGHNPLLINTGIWKEVTWNAIGIGVDGQYATVWFGQLNDPNAPDFCDQ